MLSYTNPLNILVALSLLVIAACERREEILPGQRFALEESAELQSVGVTVTSANLGTPVTNSSWTHRNGTASHSIAQPALSSNAPSLRWSRDIGAGSKRRLRLSAEPVIAGSIIAAMDARAQVTAHSTSGGLLWQRSLKLASDQRDDVSGGGLAIGSGILVATTGYGEVIALELATGTLLWRHRLEAAANAAPAISGRTVIVVDNANTATALNLSTGRVIWDFTTSEEATSLLGTGVPAIAGDTAYLPFTNGEIIAVDLATGARKWGQIISGSRAGIARGFVGAISSGPVVTPSRVYAATQSGRLTAIDRETGQRLWTAREGALGPVWAGGNAVFIVSDENKVMRLDADTGAIIWARALPLFKNARRFRGAYAHYGPVLANGLLWVAGSDGQLRRFNAETGQDLGAVGLPVGAASHLAIANGALYLTGLDGRLLAFQ